MNINNLYSTFIYDCRIRCVCGGGGGEPFMLLINVLHTNGEGVVSPSHDGDFSEIFSGTKYRFLVHYKV